MGTSENEAQEIRPDLKNPMSRDEDDFEELSGSFTSDRDPYIPPEVEKRERRRALIAQTIFWIFMIGMLLATFWWIHKHDKVGPQPEYNNWI
jgi:hypothetical protein